MLQSVLGCLVAIDAAALRSHPHVARGILHQVDGLVRAHVALVGLRVVVPGAVGRAVVDAVGLRGQPQVAVAADAHPVDEDAGHVIVVDKAVVLTVVVAQSAYGAQPEGALLVLSDAEDGVVAQPVAVAYAVATHDAACLRIDDLQTVAERAHPYLVAVHTEAVYVGEVLALLHVAERLGRGVEDVEPHVLGTYPDASLPVADHLAYMAALQLRLVGHVALKSRRPWWQVVYAGKVTAYPHAALAVGTDAVERVVGQREGVGGLVGIAAQLLRVDVVDEQSLLGGHPYLMVVECERASEDGSSAIAVDDRSDVAARGVDLRQSVAVAASHQYAGPHLHDRRYDVALKGFVPRVVSEALQVVVRSVSRQEMVYEVQSASEEAYPQTPFRVKMQSCHVRVPLEGQVAQPLHPYVVDEESLLVGSYVYLVAYALQYRHVVSDALSAGSPDVKRGEGVHLRVVDVDPLLGAHPQPSVGRLADGRGEVAAQAVPVVAVGVGTHRRAVVAVESRLGTHPYKARAILQDVEHGGLRQPVLHADVAKQVVLAAACRQLCARCGCCQP